LNEFDELGEEIINLLYDSGMIKIFPDGPDEEGWKLKNGMWSPFYLQMRPIFSKKNSKIMMEKIGGALTTIVNDRTRDISKLVGVASAGVPISVVMSYKSGIPICYTRRICGVDSVDDLEKKCKDVSPNGGIPYGEHSLLEGQLDEGDNLLLVDDIITDGVSKLIAQKQVEYQAKHENVTVNCNKVIVIIDREQGGKQELKSKGLALYSLIPFKTKGLFWLQDKMDSRQFEMLSDYLKDQRKYQNINYREKIRREFNIKM
jgi:orotate phosphoribosyltransferase